MDPLVDPPRITRRGGLGAIRSMKWSTDSGDRWPWRLSVASDVHPPQRMMTPVGIPCATQWLAQRWRVM